MDQEPSPEAPTAHSVPDSPAAGTATSEGGSPDTADVGSPSDHQARLLPISTAIDGFVIGLFLLAVLAVLRVAREFLLPLVIAALLALLLDPAVRGLRHLRLPRSLATGLLLIAFLAFLGTGVSLTAQPAREYLAQAPQKLHKIEHRLKRLMRPVEEVSEAAKQVSKMTDISEKSTGQVSVTNEPTLEQSLFDGTQNFLAGTAVTFILTFFLLSSGDVLVTRWADLLGDRRRFLHIARQIQRDVSGHLWTISLINAALGVCVGLVCWWSGLPNPVLWGVVAALFNFVPYLGAAAGVVIVAGVSLLTFDSPLEALQAPTAYLVLTSLEGSFLTPMVLGHRFSLHPAIVFVGLLFWSYLWGVAGALLAVPILLILKIVCDNVPRLRSLGQAMAR